MLKFYPLFLCERRILWKIQCSSLTSTWVDVFRWRVRGKWRVELFFAIFFYKSRPMRREDKWRGAFSLVKNSAKIINLYPSSQNTVSGGRLPLSGWSCASGPWCWTGPAPPTPPTPSDPPSATATRTSSLRWQTLKPLWHLKISILLRSW